MSAKTLIGQNLRKLSAKEIDAASDHIRPKTERRRRTSKRKTHYAAIAELLLKRIHCGFYPSGRLPSQRDLAEEFGVSRNTVVTALENLKAGGWIASSERCRTVLTPQNQTFSRKLSRFLSTSGFEAPPIHAAFDRQDHGLGKGNVIDLSALCNEHWDDHINLDIDIACLRDAMRKFSSGSTDIYRTTGLRALKKALSANLSRMNITAAPEEIVIVSRRLQAYRLACEVLLGRMSEVWMPELSLVRYYGIAESQGSRRRMLPMNESGTIDFEPMLFSKRPKMVFLEPTRQKPTGSTIPAEERKLLAAAAAHSDTIIFEDAYCELMTETHLPPISSFDPKKESTIFLCGVPTWLSPVCNFNFLVANERITELIRAAARRDYLNPEFFTQLAAIELLGTGRIDKMLERYHAFHRWRLRFVHQVLSDAFGCRAKWNLAGAFGCIWLELPGINIEKLYRERKDVHFQPGWFYGEEKTRCRHILLRYTLPSDDFEEGVRRLKRLCMQVSEQTA